MNGRRREALAAREHAERKERHFALFAISCGYSSAQDSPRARLSAAPCSPFAPGAQDTQRRVILRRFKAKSKRNQSQFKAESEPKNPEEQAKYSMLTPEEKNRKPETPGYAPAVPPEGCGDPPSAGTARRLFRPTATTLPWRTPSSR